MMIKWQVIQNSPVGSCAERPRCLDLHPTSLARSCLPSPWWQVASSMTRVWMFFSFSLLPRGPLPPELFDYVAEMSRPEGELESLTPASGWRGTLRSDDEDLPGNNPIWWQSWAMRLRFFASVGNKYYHHWLSTRATNNTARHFSVFFDFHSLEMFYNIRKIGNSSK